MRIQDLQILPAGKMVKIFPNWNLLYIERGMSQNKSVLIRPAKTLAGSVRLPGDKSISHRYAMLGGIAEGATKLENFSTGADCASTLGCLRPLGVKWERNGGSVVIQGRGAKLQAPSVP